MWFWVENRIIAIHMDHPSPQTLLPPSLTSCTRAKVRIRNMGCWAAAVNHCGLAGQFIVTALPTWWQGPRLLSELPPSLCCAYVRRAWILKEVQEVANSLASWSCSPCWTLRRRHKSHTKRPTERIRNLFKNQHFLLPKHTLQYLCVWVFIYAAFFCIFQSQQSETGRGRGNSLLPLHFEKRTTESAAEICKICSFYRIYGYLCCTLNAIELALNKWHPATPTKPSLLSPFLHTAPLRAPFRRWNKRSACARFACPFSVYPCLSLSVCLSVVPFWPSFKTFSVTFCILQFQYAFLMIPIRWNWKTKPTMMQLMKCPQMKAHKCKQRVRITENIRMQLQLPLLFPLQLQSAVFRQAKLNTPSSFRLLGQQITNKVGEREL